MQFVEIYKLKNDGSQEILVVCKLIDNKVIFEGDKIFIQNLEQAGIWNCSQITAQRIYAGDGLIFLEQLKYNFKSGYLNASDVKRRE